MGFAFHRASPSGIGSAFHGAGPGGIGFAFHGARTPKSKKPQPFGHGTSFYICDPL